MVPVQRPGPLWRVRAPRLVPARARHLGLSPSTPLVWQADGQGYSPTGLSQKIPEASIGRTGALQGPKYWVTSAGETRAHLAAGLGAGAPTRIEAHLDKLSEPLSVVYEKANEGILGLAPDVTARSPAAGINYYRHRRMAEMLAQRPPQLLHLGRSHGHTRPGRLRTRRQWRLPAYPGGRPGARQRPGGVDEGGLWSAALGYRAGMSVIILGGSNIAWRLDSASNLARQVGNLPHRLLRRDSLGKVLCPSVAQSEITQGDSRLAQVIGQGQKH